MATNELTVVRLMYVPLENDYKHSFYFDSRSAQESYFSGRTAKYMNNASYQRKDNKIRWNADYDSLVGNNYVMYQNAGSTKWYYAFITKLEYVSEGLTDIYIETDVIQTWLFDYEVLPSFIEREHTVNDAVGANTIPENLETGEYVKNGDGKVDGFLMEECIIMAVTEDASGNKTLGKKYGGVFSGVGYRYALTSENAKAFIEEYDAGKAEAIQSIFLCPTALISIGEESGGFINESETAKFWDTDLGSTPTTLDGYTPRNKKLLTYPYSYLYVTNQQGGCGIYHHEKFLNGNRKFRTYGVITPGCSIRTVPAQYDKVAYNTDYAIPLGKYPICNWTSDVYTNWLTQNSINNVMTGLTSAGSIMGGVAMLGTGAGTLAGVGMIAGGITGIMSSVSQHHQHDMIPQHASGNVNCGDVAFSAGHNNFRYMDMSIKAEYARIIDEYFDMFGYKANRVKRPNKAHRANWWYTKTIDVNIDGVFPMEDMKKIKECYNQGITFWRTPANIQNYSLDNSIV